MSQALRRNATLAVVYLDLDGFKAINDLHGHAMDDAVLIAVSESMKHSLRDGDTLSRLGGDEFVAVSQDLDDLATTEMLVSRLQTAASEPILIDGLRLQVSASLGVTFYPQRSDISADQLLRQADQAMYQAKQGGKAQYCFFGEDGEHRRGC